MSENRRRRRQSDPLSLMVGGMRRLGSLDLGEVTRSLSQLGNPNGGGFLDMLGATREEQVEKMATILRNSEEADMAEMGTIFGLAAAKVAEEKASGDRDRRPAERRPDPLSRLADGIRQIGSMDFDDITRGLENFINPSARGMLDSLGRTQEEQVEKMATMLRNGTEADLEEMGTVYMLAMTRVAEERQRDGEERPLDRRRAERPRRRRGQTSAEWRQERRRAS